MLDRVLASLVASGNEAADDVLLEAMRRGNALEASRALGALLDRKTPTGVFGVLRQFDTLLNDLRLMVVERAGDLYHLLPEAGRHEEAAMRGVAIRLIALGKLGQLSYVLTENLAHPDHAVSTAAIDGLVALARFVAGETRRLQSGKVSGGDRKKAARALLAMRGDVEAAVLHAMEVYRGPKSQDVVRAALLLTDSMQSRTLVVLGQTRSGGGNGVVSPLVKRLQQAPDAEHVDAFLIGATRGELRSQFAASFGGIDSGPVLEGLMRRWYLLKDVRLELCMRNVTRGAWLSEPLLAKDLARRPTAENASVAPWIAAAGVHDVVQDEKLIRVLENLSGEAAGGVDNVAGRMRLLRIAMSRPQGASLTLLRRFLDDPDERLQRMAAREIVRRKPVDYSGVLLGLMKTAPESVRKVASRAISAGAFESFYERFDKLEAATRVRAGKAVLKLLPDGVARLGRKLRSGDSDARIKALTVTQELAAAKSLREPVLALTSHEDARVRSKAIAVAAGVAADKAEGTEEGNVILDRALNDEDARVRANAIEVLEAMGRRDHVPLLAARVRANNARERANAIKAMHAMKVEAALPQLMLMLRDPRADHRISALWAARQVGLYKLVAEVARIAKHEADPKVKRYAMASIRYVAAQMREVGKAI